jgi:hypothetical protein
MEVFFIVAVCLCAAFVLGCGIYSEIVDWRKRRNRVRIARMERELGQAQERLRDLAMEHKSWLDGQALEVRKALIAESFRAAHEDANRTHTHKR